MGGRGASSARPQQTRAQQSEWATRLQTALNGGSYSGDYSVRFDEGESGMTRLYYRGEQYMAVPNEEMTGSVNVPDYKVRRQETREQMMRRAVRASIAAIEPPDQPKTYNLGPATLTVNPLGGGRYGFEVNAAAANVGGRGSTIGKTLGKRKSVTWDELVERASAAAEKGI
ncbi:MAG: hypothetical protein IKG69_08500 [Atopobiaceae bacterium]|nr:hypothetical protein [Atopobiaceae bacterium]